MSKSAEAFRTISEVAEVLGTPAHVLRFWESRFTQIRPLKRAGGRRYYRPTDVALLAGIRKLLHEDGMTIRGVQKILREHGVRHVAQLSGLALAEAPAAEDAAAAPGAATGAATADAGGDAFAGRSWPEAPDPDIAADDQGLHPDPDDAGAGAPMLVDVPLMPAGEPDNLHHLGGRSGGRAAPAARPEPEVNPQPAPAEDGAEIHPPAAKLLRAMTVLHAYENRAGLRAVHDRLTALRDRVAAEVDKHR
ncbi:MAG: MerR family transcriptional regulator [Pseudomonadota bacterium]